MFEQIRAYKNIRKAIKDLKNFRRIAKIIHDDEMVSDANATIYEHVMAMPIIVLSYKKSRMYNLEFTKRGLDKGWA